MEDDPKPLGSRCFPLKASGASTWSPTATSACFRGRSCDGREAVLLEEISVDIEVLLLLLFGNFLVFPIPALWGSKRALLVLQCGLDSWCEGRSKIWDLLFVFQYGMVSEES